MSNLKLDNLDYSVCRWSKASSPRVRPSGVLCLSIGLPGVPNVRTQSQAWTPIASFVHHSMVTFALSCLDQNVNIINKVGVTYRRAWRHRHQQCLDASIVHRYKRMRTNTTKLTQQPHILQLPSNQHFKASLPSETFLHSQLDSCYRTFFVPC
jgi:hypothetical protein